MVPVSSCLTGALNRLLSSQPLSQAKVNCAWKASVGASLSKATNVRLRTNGTLLVVASNEHWRRETERSIHIIRSRLSVLLGRNAIKKFDITKGSRNA